MRWPSAIRLREPATQTAEATPDGCNVKASCTTDSEVHASIVETLASKSLDKIRAMAVALVERDHSRNTNSCLRRAYKVCQSLWAAEYELREYITPLKGQDLFEIGTVR